MARSDRCGSVGVPSVLQCIPQARVVLRAPLKQRTTHVETCLRWWVVPSIIFATSGADMGEVLECVLRGRALQVARGSLMSSSWLSPMMICRATCGKMVAAWRPASAAAAGIGRRAIDMDAVVRSLHRHRARTHIKFGPASRSRRVVRKTPFMFAMAHVRCARWGGLDGTRRTHPHQTCPTFAARPRPWAFAWPANESVEGLRGRCLPWQWGLWSCCLSRAPSLAEMSVLAAIACALAMATRARRPTETSFVPNMSPCASMLPRVG